MGQKTREMFELVPQTQVNTVERCAGHDGTWGVKKEYFDDSMKIGKPVFRQMAGTEPDYVSSDCAIAGRHIKQGHRRQRIGQGQRGEKPPPDFDPHGIRVVKAGIAANRHQQEVGDGCHYRRKPDVP